MAQGVQDRLAGDLNQAAKGLIQFQDQENGAGVSAASAGPLSTIRPPKTNFAIRLDRMAILLGEGMKMFCWIGNPAWQQAGDAIIDTAHVSASNLSMIMAFVVILGAHAPCG